MSTPPNIASVVDPTSRVKALIALTEELTSIFVQENESLKTRRPGAIAPLQSDKARLAGAYAQSIRQIAKDRGLVDAAGDELLADLKEITRTFEQRVAEQRALLGGAQKASESVLRAVAEEAATDKASGQYNNAGTTNDTNRQNAALALNEQA